MKTIIAIAVVFATSIYQTSAQAGINTAGVPTSCGQNTCCIPSCDLGWTDSDGCTNAQAETAGACSNAFSSADTTSDTGVDICNGSGAFFCASSGSPHTVFVVNRDNAVSVALFPATYTECTQSGQCAPCQGQGSCQNPVSIGTSTTHSCAAFNSLLASSGVSLQSC